MTLHYERFQYDRDTYLAYGPDKWQMPVYLEVSPREFARHGKTYWPSWARFMYEDTFREVERGTAVSLAELRARFGEVPDMEKAS